MKLNRHFLRLYSQLGEQQEQQITLDELAEILECTHRNALNIVTRMSEQGWISWQSQRGRGKRSSLTFLAAPEQIALESMMQTLQRGDIRSSIEQIREQARSPVLDEQLQEWLLTYFGPHSEVRQNRQIDHLRLPIRQRIHTTDPLYMNLLAESFVSGHIFDGLVRKSGENGNIVPHLAHAWEVDDARTGWTFYLRKDVLFHHGQTLTAEDVVYTFERWMRTSQRALYRFIFKQIKQVRALHPSTVHIELQQPNELFLSFLCTTRAGIVPRGLNRKKEREFGSRPSGSGPFRLIEGSEERVVLEAFKPYFQGRPHLDQVEIIHIPWRVQQTIESADPLSPFHVIPNPAAVQDHQWSQLPSPVSVRKFVTFNTSKSGPLSDPSIRAHICSCLSSFDQENSNQQPVDRHSADSPLTGTPLEKDTSVNEKQLSSSAESQQPLQILTIPQYRQDARQIAEQLHAAGYTCEVRSVPVENFKGTIRLEADMIVFSLIRDQDEQLRLFDLYQTLSGHVDPHIRIDIQQQLNRIGQQPDASERARLFQDIEQQLVNEYQLHVLYEKPVQTAYLPSVRGITFNSQGWVDLRHIWFPSKEI